MLRPTARVIVLDPEGCVLLLRCRMPEHDPRGTVWITPGGGLDAGESPVEGAIRELAEETGLVVTAEDLGAPVATLSGRMTYRGRVWGHDTTLFVHRCERFAIDDAGWTDIERANLSSSRWWSVADIDASTDHHQVATWLDLLRRLVAGEHPDPPVTLPDEHLGRRATRWLLALGDTTVPPEDALGALHELIDQHERPPRRYHTFDHVDAVLDAIDQLEPSAAVTPAQDRAVRLAAFFHDAIYDATAAGNEAASAALATEVLQRLGVDAGTVAETARLVELTAGHTVAGDDRAGALMADADLAILAAPADRYDAYARAIREEYGHVAADAYRAGRAAVLRSFLDRPAIFRTAGAAGWDDRARANLARELAALEGPAQTAPGPV